MVPRSFYSLCLHGLIVFGLATKGYAQSPGVLRLPMDQWQMHIGDDERCAAIEANACTVQKFTDDINRYGIEWRRITVTLPPQLLESRQQTALIIQGQQPVYQVFVNGELIGGSGSFSTFTGPLYSRAVFNLPANASADGRLTIAIRVLFIHPSLLAAGFDPAIALLGATQSVMNEDTLAYLKVNWQHYVCFVLLGCTGMVFFLLFSINTRLHEYFWLGALLTLLFSFRLGEFASVVNIGVPSWAGVINYNFGNGIQSLIIVEFVFAFLGRPVPRIFRGLQLIGSLSVLNVFLLAPFVYHAVYPFIPLFERFVIHSFGIAITLANLAQLLVLPMCFRSRLAEMRWIGGAVLFLTVVEGRWQAGWSFSLGFPQ